MPETNPATDPTELARRCRELVDDSPYTAARDEAAELGARSPDPLTADILRTLAALVGTQACVCIGTAPAVSALAVAAGAGSEAVITCITDDPHYSEVAKQALRSGGHPASASRFITSRPLEVVDKLADTAYDLIVADLGDYGRSYHDSIARLCASAARLLRPGGALVLLGEHAPLPEGTNLPESVHVVVIPVGVGLTVLTF